MKSFALIALAALALPAGANEALKLLSEEAEGAPNVYEEAARLAAPRKKTAEGAEKTEPSDPRLPGRWETELEPKFPFQVSRGTRVAPRGLIEYQNHNRSIARGSRLSRARFGVAVDTYYDIEVLAEALLSSSGEYEGWETLRASLPLGEEARLTLGKFPPPFSTEYTRDAAVRWFPTLSPFAAQLAPASSLGALMEGRGKTTDWKLGWFGSDADRSLPSPEGRGAILAGFGTSRNREGVQGAPEANYQRWHIDYLYNMEGADSESIAQGYRHLISAGTQYSAGRLDFYTELLAARGSENTVYGVTAAGHYWLLQDAMSLVARYQYARSREPGGVFSYWGIPNTGADAAFPANFPAVTVAGQMTSLYSGINVHFDDDNFIIGTGMEYRSLSEIGEDNDSFTSWGWNTFARYAF